MLRNELPWKRLPPRQKRLRLLRILAERMAFFMEVREKMAAWRKEWVPSSKEHVPPEAAPLFSYCNHCGGCCEIASGLPDFPSGNGMPEHWKALFGCGLGWGHRFCPFLWEEKETGKSLCAVHPWRSNPCRTFEQEECEQLMRDPTVHEPSHPRSIDTIYRMLIKLSRSRLPRRVHHCGAQPSISAQELLLRATGSK